MNEFDELLIVNNVSNKIKDISEILNEMSSLVNENLEIRENISMEGVNWYNEYIDKRDLLMSNKKVYLELKLKLAKTMENYGI